MSKNFLLELSGHFDRIMEWNAMHHLLSGIFQGGLMEVTSLHLFCILYEVLIHLHGRDQVLIDSAMILSYHFFPTNSQFLTKIWKFVIFWFTQNGRYLDGCCPIFSHHPNLILTWVSWLLSAGPWTLQGTFLSNDAIFFLVMKHDYLIWKSTG